MLNALITVREGPPVGSGVLLKARTGSVQMLEREVPVFDGSAKRVRNAALIECRFHQKAPSRTPTEPGGGVTSHSGLA